MHFSAVSIITATICGSPVSVIASTPQDCPDFSYIRDHIDVLPDL